MRLLLFLTLIIKIQVFMIDGSKGENVYFKKTHVNNFLIKSDEIVLKDEGVDKKKISILKENFKPHPF